MLSQIAASALSLFRENQRRRVETQPEAKTRELDEKEPGMCVWHEHRLPFDLEATIMAFLDLRSVARLERASKSMSKRVIRFLQTMHLRFEFPHDCNANEYIRAHTLITRHCRSLQVLDFDSIRVLAVREHAVAGGLVGPAFVTRLIAANAATIRQALFHSSDCVSIASVAALALCPRLQTLNLDWTRGYNVEATQAEFTDVLLRVVSKCKNISSLSLRTCDEDDDDDPSELMCLSHAGAPALFRSGLPLTYLKLNAIRDAALEALKAANMTQLRELRCEYEGTNLKLLSSTLCTMTSLRVLSLTGVVPEDPPEDPSAFAVLPSLTDLEISVATVISVRAPKLNIAVLASATKSDNALLSLLEHSRHLEEFHWRTDRWTAGTLLMTAECVGQLQWLLCGPRNWRRLTQLTLNVGIPTALLPWLAASCTRLESLECMIVISDAGSAERDFLLTLQQLPQLRELFMQEQKHNERAGSWPAIEQLEGEIKAEIKLPKHSMHLHFCNESILSHLRCPRLEHLHLVGNRCSGSLATILKLSPKLSCLMLGMLPEGRDFVPATPLALTQLRVRSSPWSDDDVLSVVRCCPNLRKLNVARPHCR